MVGQLLGGQVKTTTKKRLVSRLQLLLQFLITENPDFFNLQIYTVPLLYRINTGTHTGLADNKLGTDWQLI